MACYGGGHVQSLLPIAVALQENPEVDLTVLGFTTASATFRKAGVAARNYESLLQDGDEKWLEFARPHTPQSSHRDVSQSETDAYYALGLKDMALDLGEKETLMEFSRSGRKAFLPFETFVKELSRSKPDLVITSTSPRSELAAQRAASSLGIPAIAVSDLFLQVESSYICEPGYAETVTVIGSYVADFLSSRGYSGKLPVTGNPAFDNLHHPVHTAEGKELRSRLGVPDDQRVVVWVCPSSSVSMIGKPFIAPATVIDCLENLCANDSRFSYLVRQHPSNPVASHLSLASGFFCPSETSIEACLVAADAVLLETSTVGLQAAILGKPVVSMNAGDYPPYAALGLSKDVAQIGEVPEALKNLMQPSLQNLGYPEENSATELVLREISSVLGLKDR